MTSKSWMIHDHRPVKIRLPMSLRHPVISKLVQPNKSMDVSNETRWHLMTSKSSMIDDFNDDGWMYRMRHDDTWWLQSYQWLMTSKSSMIDDLKSSMIDDSKVINDTWPHMWYGVATMSRRLPKNIGLFCKISLLKRLYSHKRPTLLRSLLSIAPPYDSFTYTWSVTNWRKTLQTEGGVTSKLVEPNISIYIYIYIDALQHHARRRITHVARPICIHINQYELM